MARTLSRRQIVSRATVARTPARSGGTMAPRSAAGGPRVGLGQRRLPTRQKAGIGKAKALGGGTGDGGAVGAGSSTPYTPPPTPWNSAAESIVAGARRNYLSSQANFDLAEQEAKADYGLDQGFNDYKTNPYSRAALLEQSYQNANKGTMNSAGLQLYSGSTSNALGENRSTRDLNYNNLSNAYREALGEITRGRTEAAERRAEEEREAEWKRIEAAEASEPDAEAAPASGGSGSSGGRKRKSSGGGKGPAVGRGRKAR